MARMTSRDIDKAVLRILKSAAREGAATPFNKTIAGEIKISEYTVSRSIARLHERGLIVVRHYGHQRQVIVPGVGETRWTVVAARAINTNPVNDLPKPLRAPAETSLVGNCFAAHDADPGDRSGSFSRPATHVPTMGVLA